ncbi:MAG TPA: gluconokinase [Galbitalea sp.]|jgi:carbohydrate kinase (thermoresistant glucokinase family)|nr:gluconokinase [Galbitalea sp.]
MPPLPAPVVLVIMGVSGAGKSTIGLLLAERLGWQFEEGDSLHPASNVEKMSEGIPLSDEDRWPWLAKIADWIDSRLDTGESGIITCSALKRSYRNVLNRRGSGVEFVYLAVEVAELTDRVEHREDHFMPASLLTSQLGTLEIPTAAEPAIQVDADPDARLVVDRILRDLELTSKTVRPPKAVKKPSVPSEPAPKPQRTRRPTSPRQTR